MSIVCLCKSNDEDIVPFFPPEIEHFIFTLAYDPTDIKASASLILVAHRIRSWIRPLIYRVIDFYNRSKPRPDFRRDGSPAMEDIGQHIHVLILGSYYNYPLPADQFIQHCPNLHTLASWQSTFGLGPILPSLKALPNLRHISAHFIDFSTQQPPSPVFTQLSHLEMVGGPPATALRAILAYAYSSLTHLLIEEPADTDAALIQAILHSCSNIQILILAYTCYWDNPRSRRMAPQIRQLHEEEPRLALIDAVMIDSFLWVESLHGGKFTIWTFAEYIITARKNKYLLPGDYQHDVFLENFDWFAHLTEEGQKRYAALTLKRTPWSMI